MEGGQPAMLRWASIVLTRALACGPIRSGFPVPRYVSLKSDKVNMHIGPAKTYEVKWLYQRAGLPVEIIAESVQFLGSRDDTQMGGGNGFTPRSDVPADTRDFEPAGAPSGGGAPSAGDDDIPF